MCLALTKAVKCYDRTLERNPDSYITLTNRAVWKPRNDHLKYNMEQPIFGKLSNEVYAK